MLTPQPFFFLRHGETDWNRERRAQGQIDIPLNPTGIAQAVAARDRLRHCGIATVCSSPLQRALATAQIVNQALRRPLVVIDALKERHLGAWQGEVAGADPPEWLRGKAPPGGETDAQFLARALAGLNAAIARDGPVLIVAHGGVYWAMQRHAGLDHAAPAANALPLRHDPPGGAAAGWAATVVG